MTHLHRFLASLATLLGIILATSSCRPTQEPAPTPQPDTIDTITPQPNPDPQPFQSILELDDKGELKSIPFPCVDWLGGREAVEAFEKSKGATFLKEQAMGAKKGLLYKTNDPKNLQPQRVYMVNPDKKLLETSSIMIASHLVAEGDHLNENMEILLHDDGYMKVEGAKGIAYSNGTYLLAFSKLNDNAWTIAYTSEGDPSQHAGILQIKDFPYLKKETKMSTYTFAEIEAYEQQLGLRKQTSKTATSVIYQAIDPSKVNLTYVRYDINPSDESKSGPVVRTDRFSKAMYKQPELRSYFELNGFTYEGAFGTYSEKFANKNLAVRMRLSDKNPGAFLTFEDAPDLYSKEPEPEQPKFQTLYLPLLDAFGEKITKDSPLIAREQEAHPDCEVLFRPADEEKGYKYDAIKVSMPLAYKLDPEDRTKPRAVAYVYESATGSTVDKINYIFSQEWEKAKISGDNALVKDFMEKHGFTYKGVADIDQPFMKAKLYQYYNAKLGVYFEYSLVSSPFPGAMGTYTKTPTLTM